MQRIAALGEQQMVRAIFATASLLLVGSPLMANVSVEKFGMQTGSHALAMCGDDASDQEQLVCFAWINGAIQAAALSVPISPQAPSFCTPDRGGSLGQYRDVFVKFLNENPAIRHKGAIFLLYQAMAQAFPCAKK